MSVLSKNGGAAAAAAPTVRPAVLLSRPYHAALQEAVEAAAPDLRKAEATRLRLLAATARLLEEHGLARLKVTDIADGAGAAHGTFYSYFRDKRDAAEAVLTAFATDCIEAIGAGSGASGTADAYASIRAAIAGIATTYRLNPGLSRCLWQLDDSGTAIEHVVQDINTRWHRRIADSLLRRAALPEAARREATVVAYALAAMVDEFLIQHYLRRDPTLGALGLSDGEIVDALAFLWFRAAHGRDPERARPADAAGRRLLSRLGAFR